MRAELPKREPGVLEQWRQSDLYAAQLKAREGAVTFHLHDGPPFANGDAHMGHALNMALKDFVLKSRYMSGFQVPFVPGWDCHGLPIEHKVQKELAEQKKTGEEDLSPAAIRERCQKYAEKFIAMQSEQFQRLGVFGDWAHPYLTMAPAYEADILRIFAGMVERDLVFQALRPVYWSTGCQTALAEAEVEYQDRTDTSIYVEFPLTSATIREKLGLDEETKVHLLIWTTTPWTLPANLGVAAHPAMEYVLAEFEGRHVVCAKALAESVASKREAAFKEIKTFKGRDLTGWAYQHPFLDRVGEIHEADFVTAESGTGLVHIAPGHGHDDFQLGQRVGLGVLSPVDDNGRLTAEAGLPELTGTYVLKANKAIVQLLDDKGLLWSSEEYRHSYPHCWRSKTPIVFRSVTQWFIKVDAFRQAALDGIEQVAWIPSWGKNRIRGAVETRPDWCISRQRTWGVPIPVFYDADGKAQLDAAIVRKVADLVEQHGTNYWFQTPDEEMAKELGLPDGYRKGLDTLDVWIDSGSSHAAVVKKRLSFPADLYLEGSDQHRGWFQSSLLTSVAIGQPPPYKQVLTNGFIVDLDGKKMSKSSGKPVELMVYVNQFGADVLRLWVASQDYRDDVPFSDEIFKRVTDTYRSFRNMLRILLANLDGFDLETDRVADENLDEVDRYILLRLQDVVRTVRSAYDAYEFHQVYHTINRFCAVDLSALYIDVLKDRMYCESGNSPLRRSSQTAMYEILHALCTLMAPITPFTCEEAWQFSVPFESADPKEIRLHRPSVHLERFPEPRDLAVADDFAERWKTLLEFRALINEKLELLRKDKKIGKSLEARVVLHTSKLSKGDESLLAELCIVSQLEIKAGEGEGIEVAQADGCKCARCWRFFEKLGEVPGHPELCERCGSAVVQS